MKRRKDLYMSQVDCNPIVDGENNSLVKAGDYRTVLKDKAELYGFHLSDMQANQLIKYFELMAEKNKDVNLTRIIEFDEVVEKHFVDSMMGAAYLNMSDIASVIDIGTGAGFPGIPLKILYPDIKLTMIDSVSKKISFINEAAEKIHLKNVEALHVRAEDLARDPMYRERYDLCVSRAVANLSTLSEYALPFVKVGGVFLAYKSDQCEEEISNSKNAVSMLGGEFGKINQFSIFGFGRTIIEIRKVKKTARMYPRKAGVPSKKPL
jgi:16S rRNA (guanine527-N7)-methyltransferase